MNYLISGLVVVIAVLGGFYGGAKYGQSHPTAAAAASGTPSPGQGGGAARSGVSGRQAAPGGSVATPAVAGQIVAVGSGTITVHDRQSDKDVKVNISGARITKTVQGSPGDLTQNEVVTITGQTGSDGVVNAQLVAVGGGAASGGAGGRARPSPSG